jgi:hypothetical protein
MNKIKSILGILVFAGFIWACTGLGDIGQNSFFDDTFPMSTADNQGGTLQDDNWVGGIVRNGAPKAYHLHSLGGSPDEGCIDQVTNVMVVY